MKTFKVSIEKYPGCERLPPTPPLRSYPLSDCTNYFTAQGPATPTQVGHPALHTRRPMRMPAQSDFDSEHRLVTNLV